jgi:hypothetical protein
MARYLVEVYSSRRIGDLARAVARARAAAAAVSAEGIPVRHVRATLVPDDETCFHVFEGPSVEAIDQVVRRAGLAHARIVAATEAVARVPAGGDELDLERGVP